MEASYCAMLISMYQIIFCQYKDYAIIMWFCLFLDYKYHLLATVLFFVYAIGDIISLLAWYDLCGSLYAWLLVIRFSGYYI